MSRLPLVVILGATGSGKTKLSLELAQKFGGEIIGADSMQIYKGLDIITAKATMEEQKMAPHHLINILEPRDSFTVLEYRNEALRIIDDLFKKSKLPIIVGGTNYYIESLLWRILVANPNEQSNVKPGILPNDEHLLSSEELHKKLKLLDPNMARRLHPNNKRKILRSLEVLYLKGRKHSEILEEQQRISGSKSGGGLRFPEAIILWLQCDQKILDERLNKRVDSMMEEGLVQELLDFHDNYNKDRINMNETPDYTRGIFQSIGLKEFHPYLMMSQSERESDMGIKKLNECIEQLKMVTRRYARKQNKWTVNRFLCRMDREVPPLYSLDTTDPSKWCENVTTPAIEIVDCALHGRPCKYKPLDKIENKSSNSNATDDTYYCEICERLFVGNHQWNDHLKSIRHKKRREKKKKESE